MERLKTRRGSIKSKITRISNFVRENPFQADGDTMENSILYQGKLDALLAAYQDYLSIQKDIYNLIDITDAALVSEYEAFSHELEDEFYNTKSKLSYFISICGDPDDANDSLANKTFFDHFLEQQSSLIAQLDNTSDGVHQIKLQPLKIPSFNGDYKDWVSFYDIYNITVHQNTKLSNAQKLQYLKESLTGSASQMIKHFSITDVNYIEAWNMIKKRFDRKQHIVNSLIKTFMDQGKVSVDNSTNIRDVFNNITQVTRSLAALGAEYESRDLWLIFLVLQKLDSETIHLWSAKALEFNVPKLSDLLDFLENRCDATDNFSGSTANSLVLQTNSSSTTRNNC